MKHKWQYFIHSTSSDILKILKAGYILPITNLNDYSKLYPEPFVYTHLIFNDVYNLQKKYNSNFDWYWNPSINNSYIIILDYELCKEYEMYICKSPYYGSCVKNPDHLLLYSSGKLKKTPNLKKIKDHIINSTEYALNNRKSKKYSYIHSHEVLFPNISTKYIKAILINKNILNKKISEVYTIIEKYNIPVYSYDDNEPNFDNYFNSI